ncbi:MAG: HAMP domain-containing sensor histidine kinase [Azospirillaceae bacterium]|nr:HAMP domain-containing sensor histidine kinase [Azospirillaceae bacterium]
MTAAPRPGGSLFRQLFWRALLLVGLCLAMMVALSFHFQGHYLYAVWQRDIGDEATWLAARWPVGADPAGMARDWAATHRGVRLTVLDSAGALVADSRPDRPPPDPQQDDLQVLVGVAPLPGGGKVVLSRTGRPLIPMHVEFLPLLLGFVLLAAIIVWSPVRTLTRAFRALSDLAGRVAGGHFGQTLAPPRQRELAGLVTSFNDMSLALRDSELRQRRLVADVSHELRSPLARLRALGETVARRPQEASPHLAQMDAEIALMDRLIGDILDAATVAEGAVPSARKPVVLADWARDAFARSRQRLEQTGVRVAMTLAVSADRVVSVDPQRLLQALGNLVENAAAAVHGRPDPIVHLALAAEEEGWRLTVTDNGRGIPAADLPYVFDRFYRVERHRGIGGTGLGLSIVRALVVAQGGRVSLDSVVDGGTTATLSFPWDAG